MNPTADTDNTMSPVTANCLVTVDDERTFHARVDPRASLWNGFVRPTFSRDEADRIVRWCAAAAAEEESATLLWVGRAIVELTGDDAVICPPDEHGRYPLGAGAWCWSLACLTCRAPIGVGGIDGNGSGLATCCDDGCRHDVRGADPSTST